MPEKWGPYIYESRKIGSIIYFLLKKGGLSYTCWIRGPFGTHIRTMPYIGSYQPQPHPPPPSIMMQILLSCQHCQSLQGLSTLFSVFFLFCVVSLCLELLQEMRVSFARLFCLFKTPSPQSAVAGFLLISPRCYLYCSQFFVCQSFKLCRCVLSLSFVFFQVLGSAMLHGWIFSWITSLIH